MIGVWRWIIGNRVVRAVGAALGAILAILAYGAAQKRRGAVEAENEAKAVAQGQRLKTILEVRGHERDAETQDDAALVDRLTRR
jgi:hypothetical protein